MSDPIEKMFDFKGNSEGKVLYKPIGDIGIFAITGSMIEKDIADEFRKLFDLAVTEKKKILVDLDNMAVINSYCIRWGIANQQRKYPCRRDF